MTTLEKLRTRYSSPPPKVQLLFDGVPVAELSQHQGKYRFQYLEKFTEKQLLLLPGFPKLDEIYESVDLFPFFEERIPDIRRPEVREWIKQQRVSETDKLALLDAVGRKVITDSFEMRLSAA
jgi:HipA-like protein